MSNQWTWERKKNQSKRGPTARDRIFNGYFDTTLYVFEVNVCDLIFIILTRDPLIVCFHVFPGFFTLYSKIFYTCSENDFPNFTV